MNLEKAFEIAKVAHAGQVRKNGEACINHPIRVAFSAGKLNETAAIVGMLHDVFEDSELSPIDLFEAGFSDEVVTAVEDLTTDSGESYVDYIRRCKETPLTRIVKIADIEDNLNGATGTLKAKYQLAKYILEDI